MPMQPKPSVDTSRLLFPSVRCRIVLLLRETAVSFRTKRSAAPCIWVVGMLDELSVLAAFLAVARERSVTRHSSRGVHRARDDRGQGVARGRPLQRFQERDETAPILLRQRQP